MKFYSVEAQIRRWTLGVLLILPVIVQCEEKEPYQGKFIGKISSYHHEVSGDVYAVDEFTFLITKFHYDGNGDDTFFWAGSANRPGPLGFIVPNEYGRTNILSQYLNKDFTLTLPDGKKITEIRWLAVYDLASQNTFGDIYIPDEFEPPAPQKISELSRKSHDVSSGPVQIINAKTILIPELTYNGKGKATYFWVGVGPQPSSKGSKIPDEYGYINPIRIYRKESVTLELPGQMTIFDIDWLSIFDVETNENFGSVIIPDGLNVPPSLVKLIPRRTTLPNCRQLHKKLQVSWEIFGVQITIQLAGQIGEDDYMAFGISGAQNQSQMLGSDVAIAYTDGVRGYATDFNITANSQCVKVLGQYKGVCRDDLIGGLDDNQLHTSEHVDGVTVVTYRRTLISSDKGDRDFKTDEPMYVVWAIGRLDHNREPTFHDYYTRGDVKMELSPKEKVDDCLDFTLSPEVKNEPWDRNYIADHTIRTFTATLGPSGLKRGYQGLTGTPDLNLVGVIVNWHRRANVALSIGVVERLFFGTALEEIAARGMSSMGLAWYINGLLIPELWLRRGLTYAFRVYGGNNPHNARTYHPFIITDDPHGGFDRLTEAQQKKVRVLAGVEFLRRGQPRPLAAGALCISLHHQKDRRLDDIFPTFKKFNRSLEYNCEKGEPAILEVTPNTSWPDIVYYNSFTHSNMGWKIHIVDNFNKNAGIQTVTLSSAIMLLGALVHLFL